jgi:hypothetical protein
MSFRRMLGFHESAPGNAHLGRQFRPLCKKRDRFPELLDIPRRIQKAGLALIDQLAP